MLSSRIDDAFAEIRRQGIVVKRNVMSCCQSCVDLNLADEVPVLWSFGGQGNRNVVEGDHYEYSDWMFNHDNLATKEGLTDAGKRVLATLAKYGIAVDWEEEDPTLRPHRKLTLNLEKSVVYAN